MGNRAVITTPERELGVYLHWNGGRDSIEAFLKYCELREFRPPEDQGYGWARLCQVIGNFLGADGLSIGIVPYTSDDLMNPGDNGIYIIRNWQIVDRIYPDYSGFEEQNEYNLEGMLEAIDERQPKDQQLGDYLKSEEIPTSSIKIGDMVFIKELNGVFQPYEVIGIGPKSKIVNGHKIEGIPYVNHYVEDAENNINNYLLADSVRIYAGA